MTREQFHDAFRGYTRHYPWEPVPPLAVLLTDDRRAFIDMPEQVEMGDEALVLTRRSNPSRPERYPYAAIDRLVPVDQLPADPGALGYAEFDPLIRRLLMAEPFQPFVIELRTGERIEIRRRPEIGRAGRFVNLYPEAGGRAHYTYDQIARLVPRPGAVPA